MFFLQTYTPAPQTIGGVKKKTKLTVIGADHQIYDNACNRHIEPQGPCELYQLFMLVVFTNQGTIR
jgi:hypothetical protein